MNPTQPMNMKRFYFVVAGTTTDDYHPLMQVRYIGSESIHTIAFDNDGGGSADALLVSLVTGTTTTTFDVDGADETAATLQALVDGINAVSGWEARRADGPAEFDLDQSNFIDLAATAVPRTWYSCLYRDTSGFATDIDAGHIATCRIASPDYGIWTPVGPGDSTRTFGSNQGKIEIVRIDGYLDSGAVAANLQLYQDQGTATDGSDRVHIATWQSTANAGTTIKNFLDREPGKGIVAHGPLYFTVDCGTDNEPDALDLSILWRPVD